MTQDWTPGIPRAGSSINHRTWVSDSPSVIHTYPCSLARERTCSPYGIGLGATCLGGALKRGSSLMDTL